MEGKEIKIAIIGLGYVGLPLSVEFAKKYKVTGYDINSERIKKLQANIDETHECNDQQLKQVKREGNLQFTDQETEIKDCNLYIVTVPTPIDRFNNPDLQPLKDASLTIGKALKKGDIVVYESTTYPGCTEEDCVPLLEKVSGLKSGADFGYGYSPERINPGDPHNTLTTIKKVTSGNDATTAETIDQIYRSIITAGTYKAPSIKVAEAAKAIENAQRDINISFVNELSLIFDRLGIDTNDVLEAAGTKWNFQHYRPGLVGGHCIGVDPYYLAHKAKELGYYPEVILSGRRVNNSIAQFIADKVVKLMIKKDLKIKNAKVLILGFAFKENCTDTRNTKVIDIYKELKEFGLQVDIYDPWVNYDKVKKEYGLDLIENPKDTPYEAVILAVAHKEFETYNYRQQKENGAILFDVKGVIDRQLVDARL